MQATIGNAATAKLLRRPATGGLATPEHPFHEPEPEPGPERAEFVTADPVPAMPKDVAERLLAVRGTLRNVVKLPEKDRAMLRKAIPGAPIIELIERRDMRRGWLENLPAMLAALAPPAGQPDDPVAYQMQSLTQTGESYRAELEELQVKIDAIVKQTGATSEQELAKLISEDFPKLFIRRAKDIANRQLWDNLQIAEAEGARYGVGYNPDWGKPGVDKPYVPGMPKPEEAPALRAAAAELLGFRQRRELAQANYHPFGHMEDEWQAYQAGEPDPDGGQALQIATEAEEEARGRICLRFPILYKLDLEKVVKASDDEISRQVCGQLQTLDYNIKQTITNIREDKLEIWNLRGIVDLTMLDLGIEPDSPLMGAVQKHIDEAKADEGMLDMALTALQITAGIVATFATGGLALAAGAVALGVGAYQLSNSVERYMTESFASNVALDPAIADISVNEPQLMPIVIGVVGLGLDGAALTKAIVALRAPARALLAEGDVAGFSAAAYQHLPKAQADMLVQRAALLPEVVAKGATGTAARGAAWTHEQIQELFIRAFKRPGPPQSGIVIHASEASYDAARTAAGLPDNTFGFFMPATQAIEEGGDVVARMGAVHLPPTASTLTVIHESLHVIGRQSGVEGLLGRYVEEGLTELLAREAFGPEAGRFIYEGNMAFVKLLGQEVGLDTLRNAYLHRNWGALRAALKARLGGRDDAVSHLYSLLRQVGPNGQRGGVLDEVSEMLWPGRGAP